jgi:geranylgeranyl pyrophosphate synthase
VNASLVRAVIHEALTSGAAAPLFQKKLAAALHHYPHPLHPDSPLRPAHLALGSFLAAGGSGQSGLIASAAMEVMVSASHVLDAVADRDRETTQDDSQIGPALIFLASRILQTARTMDGKPFDWSPVFAALEQAASGQQRDIELQSVPSASLEDAKEMTEAKAGSIGEAIALAGAIAAEATPERCSHFAQFGRLVATRSQLIDDATDASTKAPGTSDIRLKKKTVPIAYFLHTRGDEISRDEMRDRFLSANITHADEMGVRRVLQASGAIDLTLTLAHWYRMKAESLLEQLERHSCQTQLLRLMLEESPPHKAVHGSQPISLS